MSDWLLYHVWSIRGYRVVGQEKFDRETVLLTIEPLPSLVRCSQCRSPQVIRKGVKVRMLRGTSIGRRQVYLETAIPRVHCEQCGITRQIQIPFAQEKRR